MSFKSCIPKKLSMFSVQSRTAKAGVILALCAALFSPGKSLADSFFYHFNNVFYGMTPTGVSPWVDVLFTDSAPGKVTVTVSTPGLIGNEYVAGLYLNMNPDIGAGSLSFTVL